MNMERQRLSYGVAIASTLMALLLSLWLEDLVTKTLGAFFYIAIAISTRYGGRRSGMAAIILSVLLIDYFLIPPIHHLQISNFDDVLRLALIAIIGSVINGLGVNLKGSQHSEAERDQLPQQGQTSRAEGEKLPRQLELERHRSEQILYRFQDKHGTLRWISSNLSSCWDDLHHGWHAIAIDSDITERKRAEQALAKELLRIQTLFNTTLDGIVIVDEQGHVLEANPRFAEMLGYPLDEVATLSIVDWDAQFTPEVIQQLLENSLIQRNGIFETQHRRKNGSIYDVEVSYSVVEWDGNILRFCSCRDISERKQMEAERYQWQLALQEKEASYRQLFENNPQPMWVYDLETLQFLAVNSAAVIKYGYSAAEFLSMTIADIRPPQDVPRLRENVRQVTAGLDYAGIWQHQLKDGSLITVEIISHTLEFSGRRAELVLANDITEHNRVQTALQESEEKLRLLIQHAPVGIAMFDRHMCYITTSQRWLDDYHPGSSESLVGRSHYEAMPGIPEHYRAVHQRCLAGAIEQGEDCFLGIGGTEQWTRWEVRPWYQINGEIGGIIIFSEYINERKQAELALHELNQSLEQKVEERTAELRARKAQIRAIVEAIPDLLLRVTRDGICLDRTGLQQQIDDGPHVQRHLSDVLPPDLLHQQLERIEHAITTGIPQVYEHLLPRGDDSVYEEVRIARINSHEALVIVRDISDRKRVEESLRQSEATNRALMESIPDLLVRMRRDGLHLQIVNQGAAHNVATDVPLEQSKITEIMPEAIAQERITLAQRAIQTGQVQRYEYHFVDQGETFYEEARIAPLNQDEVLVVVRDITDLKRVEHELQESQQFIQQIADASPNILYLYDLQRRCNIYSNREIITVLGYSSDDIQAMGANFIQTVMHPDDLERLPEQWERLGNAQDHEIIELEYRMRHVSGEWRWLYSRDTVFKRDASGRVQQILGTAQDITHLKQIQQLLNERNQQLVLSNQELARATRLKDEFLANMSHELRTPLNAILGMAEGLQEGALGDINQRQLDALRVIERSGSHLLNLINDILDLAKIESGQNELNYAPTNLKTLCCSSLEFVKQQALKKQIQLDLQLPSQLPELVMDERRILQVLVNLLNNAVKFTPNGGRITLKVSSPVLQKAEEERTWLRLAVQDTGVGIAPEYIPKLFQSFVQIDSALNRQYEGTGLGLALVKRIVEQHGGQVELTSEVGVGSCFIIDLPYVTARPPLSELLPPIPAHLTPEQPEQAIAPLILLVEDNETNILMLTHYLQFKGSRLLIARDGQEAIALTQAEHPDLILMDIQMPGIDGLEAIQRIRRLPDCGHTPIIALTALTMQGDRERCLAAGADDYLSKPVRLKQLVAKIQQYCPTVG